MPTGINGLINQSINSIYYRAGINTVFKLRSNKHYVPIVFHALIINLKLFEHWYLIALRKIRNTCHRNKKCSLVDSISNEYIFVSLKIWWLCMMEIHVYIYIYLFIWWKYIYIYIYKYICINIYTSMYAFKIILYLEITKIKIK